MKTTCPDCESTDTTILDSFERDEEDKILGKDLAYSVECNECECHWDDYTI